MTVILFDILLTYREAELFLLLFFDAKKGSPYGPPFYSTFRHISQVQQKASYSHITGYSPLQVLTNLQQQCAH